MSWNMPDSADGEYEMDQQAIAEDDERYMAGYDGPMVLDKPCDCCGLVEAFPGEIDCLACCIEGDLEWVQAELRMANNVTQ